MFTANSAAEFALGINFCFRVENFKVIFVDFLYLCMYNIIYIIMLRLAWRHYVKKRKQRKGCQAFI